MVRCGRLNIELWLTRATSKQEKPDPTSSVPSKVWHHRYMPDSTTACCTSLYPEMHALRRTFDAPRFGEV
jgi:hypothetical protein